MNVWTFILNGLEKNLVVTLLYVLDSRGSSPGRKGFIMAVNEMGVFEGTIGGGMMEVKMIELAKSKMEKQDFSPIIKEQFHTKTKSRNQSGLICSGEQVVAIIPLRKKDIEIIQTIQNRKEAVSLNLNSANGLEIVSTKNDNNQLISESEFNFIIKIKRPKIAHVFGAGHVGLALAKQLAFLDYRVIQYDDRAELSTLQKNTYSNEIKIIDYNKLEDNMTAHPKDVVVIVSFSYRTDKIILKQLYNQKFAYIGMMGSDHKIETLKKELAKEGINETELSHVYAPIGLNMYSKTAAEIAVSIAGQIIREANKNLPTGRKY